MEAEPIADAPEQQADAPEQHADAPEQQVPLLNLPTELLPTLCEHLTEREVFAVLGTTCKHFAEALHSKEFYRSRALLGACARATLGADARLAGCTFFERRSTTALPLQFGDSAAKVASYLAQGTLDLANGSERWPLTCNVLLHHSELRPNPPLYGTTPPMSRFTYDAGPVPAPVRLQVFRRGRLGRDSLGFALRVLEPVKADQMLCTYWGEYNSKEGRPHDFDYDLCVEHPGAIYMSQQAQTLSFHIRALHRGNAARWVNHSREHANVYVDYLEDTTQPIEAGCCVRRISNKRVGTAHRFLEETNEWVVKFPGPTSILGPKLIHVQPDDLRRLLMTDANTQEKIYSVEPMGAHFGDDGATTVWTGKYRTVPLPLVGYFAKRDLEEGEEALFDYGFYRPQDANEEGLIEDSGWGSTIQSHGGLLAAGLRAFKHMARMGGGHSCELLREAGTDRRVVGVWLGNSDHEVCAYGREKLEWLRTTDHPDFRPPKGFRVMAGDEPIQDGESCNVHENGELMPMATCIPRDYPIPQQGSWPFKDEFEGLLGRDDMGDKVHERRSGPEWFMYNRGLQFWPAFRLYGFPYSAAEEVRDTATAVV